MHSSPFPALVSFGALALFVSPALADEGKEACVAAHADGQKLRTDSKLRSAREKFLLCARPECPAAVRTDCAKWLGELQDEMPSLVIVATDANGNDVADVKVSVDGAVIATELNGQPLLLDPGQHTLRFEREGAGPVERKMVIRVGERDRRVEVTFTPKLAGAGAAEPAAPASSGPVEADHGTSKGGGVPTATWVLGGIGVVGLGGFAVFALNGRAKENDLEKCKPNCAHSDVQSAKTSYLIGDISLGVGVVALAGATYFLLANPSKSETAKRAPFLVDVRPTAGGATGFLSGQF